MATIRISALAEPMALSGVASDRTQLLAHAVDDQGDACLVIVERKALCQLARVFKQIEAERPDAVQDH